jgi:hypothetical protein
MHKCIELIKKKNSDYIITKRQKLLRELENDGMTSMSFTHIFVDEFQDCTQSDYKIFNLLVRNVNNIVFAGDVAQAVHIGKVADFPRREREGEPNRKIYHLKGSYRLPFRISESISNFSAIIKNGSIISPIKVAPPGARPIIVYATTYNELVHKIEAIFKSYKVYGLDKITILERDTFLCEALTKIEIPCETDTVLKLKGLEKTCILWATWKSFIHKQEVDEFVYTLVSRTTGILIIALMNQSIAKYNTFINLLRKDRIILWDMETQNNFDRFCKNNQEYPMGVDELLI